MGIVCLFGPCQRDSAQSDCTYAAVADDKAHASFSVKMVDRAMTFLCTAFQNLQLRSFWDTRSLGA